MDDETCADCVYNDCLCDWVAGLRQVKAAPIRHNPFEALMKESPNATDDSASASGSGVST